MVGLVDAFFQILQGVTNDLTDLLGQALDAIARSTYWVPHPRLDNPTDLYSTPDSALWATIYDFHWNTGVPIGITILIGLWFLRTAGVAIGIMNTESKVRADKNILVGSVGIIISYWVAVVYLNIAHGLAVAIAPTEAQLTSVVGEVGAVSGGTVVAFHFLNISTSTILFILFLLVNVVRILAAYVIPMLAWFYATMYFAQIPIITPMVTDLGKKIATTALWTIPVAASWRIMVVLNSSDAGILESALGGTIDNSAYSGIDTILSTILFMIPLVVGIASPLLLSNVSQLYYLNNLAGLSLGQKKGSPGGNPGPNAGSPANGPGGGPSPAVGSNSGTTQQTLDDVGVGTGGENTPLGQLKAKADTVASGASTAASYGKRLTPGLDVNKEYIDRDQIQRDKQKVETALDYAGKGGRIAGSKAGAIMAGEEKNYHQPYNSLEDWNGPHYRDDEGWESENQSDGAEGVVADDEIDETPSAAADDSGQSPTSNSDRDSPSLFSTDGENGLDDLSDPDPDGGIGFMGNTPSADESTTTSPTDTGDSGVARGGIDYMGSSSSDDESSNPSDPFESSDSSDSEEP